jgi:hypothetical protein
MATVCVWFLPFTKKYGLTEERIKNAPHIKLSAFFDIHGPWVLVPDGSLLNFSDWVPLHLRIGPWNKFAFPSIVLVVFMTCYLHPFRSATRSDAIFDNNKGVTSSYTTTKTTNNNYPPVWSAYFCYNVFGFLYMTFFLTWVLTRHAKGLIVTFTMISWALNAMRHGLNALSSIAVFLLLNHHHPCWSSWLLSSLLKFNHIIRFPALISASIVFCVWNFVLMPFIYFLIPTRHQRIEFLQFSFSYRMVQVHIFNLMYSITSTIVTGEQRQGHRGGGGPGLLRQPALDEATFQYEDLWYALSFGIFYGLFYVFVLDRLGVHLYPVFSPRNKYFVLTWICQIGICVALYWFWNYVLRVQEEEEEEFVPLLDEDSFLLSFTRGCCWGNTFVGLSVLLMIFSTALHCLT